MSRRRDELRGLAQRSKEVLILAAVVGTLTGLGVAGFEQAVRSCLDTLDDAPLWVVAVLPFLGLALSATILKWPGSEHDPGHGRRVSASIPRARTQPGAPSVARTYRERYRNARHRYTNGARRSVALPRRRPGRHASTPLPARVFGRTRRVLLVAGAGAGVAAIFKAPATGAVFALEVPYQSDFAAPHAPAHTGQFGDGLPRVRRDPRHGSSVSGTRVLPT